MLDEGVEEVIENYYVLEWAGVVFVAQHFGGDHAEGDSSGFVHD